MYKVILDDAKDLTFLVTEICWASNGVEEGPHEESNGLPHFLGEGACQQHSWGLAIALSQLPSPSASI